MGKQVVKADQTRVGGFIQHKKVKSSTNQVYQQ